MKLTYKKQMIIAVIIIILTNIMSEIFDFWLYRSIGFGICGLIWIVHPVLPNGAEVSGTERSTYENEWTGYTKQFYEEV